MILPHNTILHFKIVVIVVVLAAVTFFTYFNALNNDFISLDTPAYITRITSVIIHILNTLAVWVVALMLISRYRFSALSITQLDNRALLAATLAAGLFGVHPHNMLNPSRG